MWIVDKTSNSFYTYTHTRARAQTNPYMSAQCANVVENLNGEGRGVLPPEKKTQRQKKVSR